MAVDSYACNLLDWNPGDVSGMEKEMSPMTNGGVELSVLEVMIEVINRQGYVVIGCDHELPIGYNCRQLGIYNREEGMWSKVTDHPFVVFAIATQEDDDRQHELVKSLEKKEYPNPQRFPYYYKVTTD